MGRSGKGFGVEICLEEVECIGNVVVIVVECQLVPVDRQLVA